MLGDIDERTWGQRMHDALEDVSDRVLRSGELPDTGGTPATVIVTVTLENLLDRLGYGRTSDGVLLSTEQVLKLAEQADIIPTVVNRAVAVLSQGRARRIATPAQTWALIARDGGCSFPGCDRAPELCERHHLVAWIDGGPTNLDNLTLLCRYHHHQFTGQGWTAAINRDGLPEWTPPAWIDRQRQPLINTRIRLGQLSRLEPAGRRRRPVSTAAAAGVADLCQANRNGAKAAPPIVGFTQGCCSRGGYGGLGERPWKDRMRGFSMMPWRISMARRIVWSASHAAGPAATIGR